jgi:hypothetical protein
MKTKIIISLVIIFSSIVCKAQWSQQQQYFDGADTIASSIKIEFDSTHHHNLWQIGKPQKTIFHSAATIPNALITDTINNCIPNDTSIFIFATTIYQYGITALRWQQKLDVIKHHDICSLEFSTDQQASWQNAFTSPISHNFYGFNINNIDTSLNGQIGLSGTDSTWRDIWFCIYNFGNFDTIFYRYSMITDSSTTPREGWMIDNLFSHQTIMHIVKENEKSKYVKVYPTISSNQITVEALMLEANQEIEGIEIFSIDGRLKKKYNKCPSKFVVEVNDLTAGKYFLKVNTNLQKKEVFPIIVTQ